MTKKDFNAIKSAVHEVCEAYEQSDSPEALSYAFYQLIRVRKNLFVRCSPMSPPPIDSVFPAGHIRPFHH